MQYKISKKSYSWDWDFYENDLVENEKFPMLNLTYPVSDFFSSHSRWASWVLGGTNDHWH